jgi:hypothetical protein
LLAVNSFASFLRVLSEWVLRMEYFAADGLHRQAEVHRGLFGVEVAERLTGAAPPAKILFTQLLVTTTDVITILRELSSPL